MKIPGSDALGSIGFVGERKAIALLCLAFFTMYFFLVTLIARTELPEYVPMFAGMLAVYLVAFFGVAAEWFWGRWFATGIGYWGCTMAIMAFVTTRSLPTPLVIFGVMHALVALTLAGEKMAGVFDAKPAWRERYKLDEQGVLRVRRSVTRAASSLPALIMFALAPRESESLFGFATFDVTALVLGGLAVIALIGLLTSLRTWTLLMLAGVGVALLVHLGTGVTHVYDARSYFDFSLVPSGLFGAAGAIGGALLIAASLPFLGPIAGYLIRGRR